MSIKVYVVLQPIKPDDPAKPNLRIVTIKLKSGTAHEVAARYRGAYVKRMYATR